GSGDTGIPQPTNTVYFSRAGKDGAYKDLKAALRAAKPGSRVVFRDGPVEDDGTMLSSQSGFPKDVTLEVESGAPPVEWRLKKNITNPSPKLLILSHLDGFTLRGFTFDGDGRVRDLLEITGICPGVVLEDIKLKNFTHTGIAINNCQGTSQRPILIRNVQVSASLKTVESAITFDINTKIRDISVNRYITISNLNVDAATQFTSKQPIFPVRPEVIDKTIKLP